MPSAAKRSTSARPMPEAAPVTTATLPSNPSIDGTLGRRRAGVPHPGVAYPTKHGQITALRDVMACRQ